MPKLTPTSRHTRGWDDLVEKMLMASDRPTFFAAMLDLQCKIVAADYGAIWTFSSQGAPVMACGWPAKFQRAATASDSSSDVTSLLAEAAKQGRSKQMSLVLKVQEDLGRPGEQGRTPGNTASRGSAGTSGSSGSPDALDSTQGAPGPIGPGGARRRADAASSLPDAPSRAVSPGPGTHVFVTLLKRQGEVRAVCTVVARIRDPQVMASTAPLREMAAGFFEGFEAAQETARHARQAEQIRQAIALLAVTQEAPGFQGACLNVVNELAQQMDCLRVSLGWIKSRNQLRVVAISDTENVKSHAEPVALLELAMSECLDQQQPIVFPPPEDAEPLLSEAVTYAHRRMTQGDAGRCVLSVPLRLGDDWLGALTLERSGRPGEPFDADDAQRLQMVADVLAPHLMDRRQADRNLLVHSGHSVAHAASYLVGPRHVGWKLLGLAVVALLLLVLLGQMPYQVRAPFTIHADARRLVPVDYQAKLKQVLVSPGDSVRQGQVLATLETHDLRLQLIEAQSQRYATRLERSRLLADNDHAKAQQADADLQQIQARIDLLQYKIDQARIRAPIDGIVLAEDWHDRIGTVLEQGENLFEVAPLDKLVVKLRVNEQDIDQISQGAAGSLATRSQPHRSLRFQVQRIVPMAVAIDGQNVFEVKGRLLEPPTWLRPGMEGLSSVDAGQRPIYWLLTHRMVDAVRLWLWW